MVAVVENMLLFHVDYPVPRNSLSFLRIWDPALLCKAYPLLVPLDVVKFSEITCRKETSLL